MPMTDSQLEALLRNASAIPPASPDLANRIISAARLSRRLPNITFTSWLHELLGSILPQPAVALATMLTLGIAIGLAIPAALPTASANDTLLQTWFADDGALQ